MNIMSSAISTPVVERRLSVIDDPHRVLVVRIGRPVPDPDPGGNWRCPYQIDGIDDASVQHAHGIDALQALIMAIEATRVKLGSSGLELSWEGGEPGENDAGIPRIMPMFLPRPFALAAERCIDQQIEAFGKAARTRPEEE